MKAAVLYEARQPLRIEELKMPDVDDEDVLIKVASCGVCHTDLKVVEGRTRFTPPTILGRDHVHPWFATPQLPRWGYPIRGRGK